MAALNEEENIAAAVATAVHAVSSRTDDYELLVYNDGSTDKTGLIADELACSNPSIKIIHHPQNKGLGVCYREGSRIAGKEFYLMVHGDNEIPLEAIEAIISRAGDVDIVIPYILNPRLRPFSRRIISRMYTLLVNALFGLRIPYYNGPCMIKTSLVHRLPIKNSGFGYMMETLVKLIKMGHSYRVVGFNCRLREKGKTKAFRIKNIINVILGLLYFRVSLRSFMRDYRQKMRLEYSS